MSNENKFNKGDKVKFKMEGEDKFRLGYVEETFYNEVTKKHTYNIISKNCAGQKFVRRIAESQIVSAE